MRGLTNFIGFLLLAGILVFSSLATSSGSPEDHSKDSPAHPKRSISAEELFRRLSPSVFVVEGLNSEGAVTTTGSGVAVDIYTPSSPQAKFERELDHILGRWYVVTNAHVIQGAVRLRVRNGSRTWEDVRGIEYHANPERDLCALTISGSPRPPYVAVREISTLRVGERVYALGAPEGLELSLSEGVIAGIRQTAQGPLIQTTTPISPGSSGGGLFDAQGRLVGITTFFLKEGQNLNFALPGEWVLTIASRGEAKPTQDTPTPILPESSTRERYNLKPGEFFYTDDWEGVVAEFRRKLQLKPDSAAAHVELAWALHNSGDVEGAVAEYREAIRLDPDDPEAHFRLGLALGDEGNLNGDIAEQREAIRLRPGFAKAHEHLGFALQKKGDLDGAAAELREALRVIGPNDFVDLIHGGLGDVLAQKGDWDGAIAEYRVATRLSPSIPGTHRDLGRALERRGYRDQAFEEYRIAHKLDPDDGAVLEHCGRGDALLSKHDVDGAITEYMEAIRRDPDNPDSHLALGSAFCVKHALREALAEYKEAMRLKPDHPKVHYSLGQVLEDEGDLASAFDEYDKALYHAAQNYPEARYRRGLISAKRGDLDAATHDLQEAVRELPDNAQMHHDFGQVLERRGDKRRRDPESALAQYRIASDLESANPQYRADYERLARKFKR